MVELPKNVAAYLRNARRRTNRLRRGRAVAAVLTLALAGLALAMAVDAAATIFDDLWRWSLSLAVYLTVAGGALFAGVWLIRRRPSLPQLAREADARHPELQERLATLVDVVAREKRGEATGASDALLALLAREADAQMEAYDCRREFPMGSIFRWLLPAFVLMLLFAGAWWQRPELTRCLAQRVLTPWVDMGNLHADRLRVEPGDLTVVAGTNIAISVTATADFGSRASIRISRWTGQGWDRERVAPMDTNGVFETVADLAEPRWRYRVNLGPAISRHYEVHVVPRPGYEAFTATIAWPDYTQLPPTVVSNAEVSLVRSVVGGRVAFTVQANPEVTPKFSLAGAEALPATSNRWQWIFHCAASNTAPWSLQMENRLGFVETVGRGRLEMIPDRPPAIAVQLPREQEFVLPPRGRLPFVFTANDDFGISAAELRVTEAETTNLLAVCALKAEPLEGTARRFAHVFDLAELDLGKIGAIQLRAVVRDGCPPEFGGYNAATSTPIRVRIDKGAKDYTRQALDALLKQTKENYDVARRNLEQAFIQSNELRRDVRRDHGEYKEPSERKLEEISRHFEEALEKVKELERSLKEDGRFDPIAEAFRKMLDEQLANAAQKLQQAQPGTENVAERAQAANELPEAMRQAMDKLRPLEHQLESRGENVKKLERLQGLAERQESLARQAERQSATQEGWRKAEAELGHETSRQAWSDESPQVAEAARQMKAAVRRSKDEEKGTRNESNDNWSETSAQDNFKKADEALQEAQKRREEAAKVEAEHSRREAEAAKNEAGANGAAKNEAGGEAGRKPLPYTDEERSQLERLHNEARSQEQKAAILEREAADDLLRMDADEATRSAVAEAIEALHEERAESGRAFRAFLSARWNKRQPAPEGKNAELAQKLTNAREKLQAAQQASEMRKTQPGTSREAAREAAEQLHRAVAAKRQQMGMAEQSKSEGEPSQEAQRQSREAPYNRQVRTPQLQPLPPKLRGVLSQEEWIRIRAVLGDAESVDVSRVPEEYRELVKRYFHILAGEH